ncbi:hypothetical protein CcaCcLH18_03508 [Colletotrichum camelliae]|nr:hypothetical protein CcaCcLH18_03508 [Colletotrichum camelliae]
MSSLYHIDTIYDRLKSGSLLTIILPAKPLGSTTNDLTIRISIPPWRESAKETPGADAFSGLKTDPWRSPRKRTTAANTPAPAPTEQVGALDTQQQEHETPNEVWSAAFRKFQESDEDLAKAYAEHLTQGPVEDVAVFDVDFVSSTVKKLERTRDEKQWKFAFAGKSIHVRSQVEKMVKFLLWTDTLVKAAVNTQPHAALAWSAVSIFLPLLKAGTELHEAMLAGLEKINRMLVFWEISESSVYPFRSHARKSFYNVFIELHHQIIRYYAHAICHLSSRQRSRAWEKLVGWNGWEADTKSINELNETCQSYLEVAQLKVSQDAMESRLVEIYNSRRSIEEISQSLKEIQFRYEDKIEGDLLGTLYADFKGHKNANPERVQGTFFSGYQLGQVTENGDEKRTRACDAIAAILHQLFVQDLTGNLIKMAKAAYHSAGAGLRDSFDELWDIFGLFEPEHPSQSSHINGDDRLHEISEEIELVIEENLPAITGHLSQNDQEEIGEHLKAMENCTYLWLHIIHLFESLPAEVSQVYEKVLRRSYNDPKTQLLFQLMLAAPRPLKLREADEAVTIFSAKTNQWKTKKEFHDNCWGQEFQSVVQNCTGFLVVIVKNWDWALPGYVYYELSFVHQTVREFLLGLKPTPNSWKGRFSYPETQAAMLSACLKSFPILQLPSGYDFEGDWTRDSFTYEHNFLRYAANFWPMHYELQDNDAKEELYGQAQLLCDTAQPSTAAWLDSHNDWPNFRDRAGLDIKDFDILTIAAFCGLAHLVGKITQTDAVDFSQARHNTVSPLQAASLAGKLEAVKALVRNNADINYGSSSIGSPIDCAIKGGSAVTVEFLLSCIPLPVVTGETLCLAANCREGGGRMLELLLQRYPDMEVPENAVQDAASNRIDASQMIEALLRERRALIPSDETICSAIGNEYCSLDVLNALVHRRSDLHVTEKMVEAACTKRHGALEVLNFLYERSSDAKVSELALTLAAANEELGGGYPAFHAAARNSDLGVEMLRLLFELEDSEQVTPDLILSALYNFSSATEILDFLACQDGFSVSNGWFETWFQTEQDDPFFQNVGHAMRLGGDEIRITDTMMKAIVQWKESDVHRFLKNIGVGFSVFVTDDLYNQSHQACQASRHPVMDYLTRFDRYYIMHTLLNAQGAEIQMKGDDGHRLTKDEAMEKLELWKKEILSNPHNRCGQH